MERAKAKDAIALLVKEFNEGKKIFKDARRFDEAKTRAGFIDPFFEALGWAVKEGQRRIGKSREVVVEDRAGKGNRQRPDYGFYINGELKFYVEAKQPSKSLANDVQAIYQLKNYVWSQRAPLGILTDFEDLLTYHGAFKPRLEKPELGRVAPLCMGHEQYLDQFDQLYDTLSREAVIEGSIERLLASVLASTARQRGQIERDLFKARGAKPVDDDFLESLTQWRESLARELARRNDFRDGQELTEVVQRFLDRLVFARVAEDRGIERSLTLLRAFERWERDGQKEPLYEYLTDLFQRLAPQFNGGLFSPHPLSEKARFDDDQILASIIKSLYFPHGQYKFDAMPVEMLGAVYEKFLGSIVRVTEGGHRAKVEEKPEVRHAGGVYYTPRYVVDAIIERTLAPLVEKATPEQVLALRIVDPACGSGSFLLGAFQYLMDWHLQYYAKTKEPTKKYKNAVYSDSDGHLHLTLQKKRDILSNCIHGVDLDPQAVEVAQMSLYLKLLEDEAEETLALQRSLEMWKADKYLPDLSGKIKCGNALIESQDCDPQLDWTHEDERRINAFDWQAELTGFGKIVRPAEKGGHGGFDAVIGNPPYIRVQELTKFAPIEVELYKKKYKTAAEGNYDIYVAFIEQSLRILRPGGRAGFILPTRWWQTSYGAALRQLLHRDKQYAEALDFAHEQVFEDPTTYTCISIFTKGAAPSLRYRRLSPEELRRSGVEQARALWEHEVPWNQLGGEPWYPGVKRGLRPLFERLRSQGPFLGDAAICPRIFQGLKTSLDSVFVLDIVAEREHHLIVRSKVLGGEELELEREPLKPIVKGGEMKRFAPLPPRKVVLFPYDVEGEEASLIRPGDFKARYPRIWRYLERNRKVLEERERGKMKRADWYAYIYPKSLTLFHRPKLLTADMADRMSFSFDARGQFYLLGGGGGGYGLLPSRPELVGPLLALLNSSLLEWMLRPPGFSAPFRGGWFSCESRFISPLPIHLPSSQDELRSLGTLAERAVMAHTRRNEARADRDKERAERLIESIEAELDERVFRLYGVFEPEQRAVQEEVAQARQSARPTGLEEEE